MKEKIVIFGKGKYYRFKKESVFLKYEIKGFIDSSAGENDSEEGLPVLIPDRWKSFPETARFLIMTLDWFAMYLQLCEFGVPSDRIILGVMEEPGYNDLEKLLHRIRVRIEPFKDNRVCVTDTDTSHIVKNVEELKSCYREIYAREYKLIGIIRNMPIAASSRSFGAERGKSIDRVYIEDFLEKHREKVHGVCMELGDDTYIQRYGHNVERSIVLHIYGKGKNAIKGNFETGDGLEDNSLDCLICTQALQAIYEVRKSLWNIYKALKPGGCVLITVAGAGGSPISLGDYHNWGVYWRFTDMSLRRLLEEVFERENVEVKSYGNVKTQMAFQYGMCAEELRAEDFEPYDEKYPMIIAGMAVK